MRMQSKKVHVAGADRAEVSMSRGVLYKGRWKGK